MRVVELSNHPGGMLQDIHTQRQADSERAKSLHEDALAQHHEHVRELRDQRDQARAQHRWWTWLRRALALWGQKPPSPPVVATRPTHQEGILRAGMTGEQLVATELGHALGDDWTLLRGYRNHRGEIDHILLGPRGLLAIEVKHRNATVHVSGDTWRFDKYDRYGNLVEQGPLEDRRGRSPSLQLNEPATELERFLRSRGEAVNIRRIVMLTHPRSRLGTTRNLTIDVVATSTDKVINLLSNSRISLDPQQLTQLERLIVRDHHHHEARRPGR